MMLERTLQVCRVASGELRRAYWRLRTRHWFRFQQAELEIGTRDGARKFIVDVAQSPQERAYGLMYRGKLARNHGMLFIYPEPGELQMWMKNTYVALDMIFIDEKGCIAQMELGVAPHSTNAVRATRPVLYVLEIAAGEVLSQGLAIGQQVSCSKMDAIRKSRNLQ